MNKASLNYWQQYWSDRESPDSVTAWQFGADPDVLAELVVEGKKTATCSAHLFYEIENEPLPKIGDYSIVLSSKDEPIAMIKTVDVSIMPMNEVPESFAIAEGEGDGTYEYWYNVHVDFFTKELKSLGKEFSEDLMLVCERFELVDVNQTI